MSFRRGSFGWLAGLVLVAGGCGQGSSDAVPKPVTAPTATAGSAAARSAPATVEPARPVLPPLQVSPARATIDLGDPGLQLLVSRSGAGGSRTDLTSQVTWRLEPPAAASIDAHGYLRVSPGQSGVVKITARLGDEVGTAEVELAAEPTRSWSFAEDVVPILTRAGCNAGGCHGRADGQSGFHLSLYGYDPASDYQAITHGSGGRRLSRMAPASSLFVAKATGRVPHVGGQRVIPSSTDDHTLLAWLEAGAPEERGKPHGALTRLAVEPADVRLDTPGPVQMRVVAHYADGHERDVTRLASYRVGDDSVISITPEGQARLLRRAEGDLVVRYQSQVVSTRLASIVNPDLDLDFAKLPRRNFIDEELFKRLASLKGPPSPPSSDAAFLRRVSLDLTGLQPQPEEVRKFLADQDPEKRIKLVDRLLGSREFVLFWKIKFGDLLQITSTRFGNGASYYHTWLEEQIRENVPWDRSVTTLLTALGNPMVQGGGPVNYALDGPDAKTSAEQTAQRFLGLRLRCAQCHDHPFDSWTQDDYFGLAAFFAKVERTAGGPGAMSGRTEVKVNPKGTVEHLRTHKPAVPKFLDGKPLTLSETDDPRKALASWMTSTENPFFARATANWVWAQFFGKGIADPADDLSKANPPVHPELLDRLARHFVEHKFDIKDLIRTVATSEAYGLSSATVPGNAADTRLFSHQIPRPLTAHQMADALAQATDIPNRFPNKPSQTRAIEVYDPTTVSNILDTFGRCSRTTGCAAVGTPPLSLRQSLLLIGGDVIESKVSNLNGYLANLLELSPEPGEIVENLYLRVLCRMPTQEELSRWVPVLQDPKQTREVAEDLFWALLNSREFAFNH
ncbi:MAG: DUF1553 domain-containing protein [Isosphaeraceae bacterium]